MTTDTTPGTTPAAAFGPLVRWVPTILHHTITATTDKIPTVLIRSHADGTECRHADPDAGLTGCDGPTLFAGLCHTCAVGYRCDSLAEAGDWRRQHAADHRRGRILVLDHAAQIQRTDPWRGLMETVCVCGEICTSGDLAEFGNWQEALTAGQHHLSTATGWFRHQVTTPEMVRVRWELRGSGPARPGTVARREPDASTAVDVHRCELWMHHSLPVALAADGRCTNPYGFAVSYDHRDDTKAHVCAEHIGQAVTALLGLAEVPDHSTIYVNQLKPYADTPGGGR